MKTRCPISAIAVTAATIWACAWLGRPGEVTYLEPFDSRMVSDELCTAVSNGVLRAWITLPPPNPTNASRNLRSLYLPLRGEIHQGRDFELRADVLRLSGDGAYAALGWSEQAVPGQGYRVLLNHQEVALVKHHFDRQILSPFFWEPLPVTNRPMTVVLRFSMGESTLSLHTRVLDQENPGIEIFNRTVEDSAVSEPVAATRAPLQDATPDPGSPWRRTGWLMLSLFGANTKTAPLEMEVDNFEMRQTLDVTAEDCASVIYTNASGQTLVSRLFVPSNQEPNRLYPLVLCLHGGGAEGDDNVRQVYWEGPQAFLSTETQARYPCFVAMPQVPLGVDPEYPDFTWWCVCDRVMGLLDMILTQYPVDLDRVYITGGSRGAIGAWMFAAEDPGRFAAVVPVASLGVSEQMKRLVSMPVWAFHGMNDLDFPVGAAWSGLHFPGLGTVTVKASRGVVADLRRAGGRPIYTEYAWVGHGVFGGAYDTPGLVDWVMAQRRGQTVQQSPWIAITAPASDGAWTTSYTNLDLTGTACADAGLIDVVGRNETLNRSGPATGTTNWIAPGIPVRPGRILGTDIVPMTNVVTVTATGTSWCDLYGGSTTFNAPLRVVQIPIRLQSSVGGSEVQLEWTGVASSFVVQRATDPGLAEWVDLTSTSQTNLVVTPSANPEFYRIKLP